MKTLTLILIVTVLSSCTTNTKMVVINYQYTDNTREKSIQLSFINHEKHAVCLSPEDWPNEGHKINHASGELFLIIGDKRFPIQDFNTGYCPKGCEIRVNPGEETFATIPYSEFNLPTSLYGEKKILAFQPIGQKCKMRHK